MMGIASFRLLSCPKTKQTTGTLENAMASKARQGKCEAALAGCRLLEKRDGHGGCPVTCSIRPPLGLGRRRRKWAVGKPEWRGTRDLDAAAGSGWLPVVACRGRWSPCPLPTRTSTCPAAAAHLFTIPCVCPPCAAPATRDGTRGDLDGRLELTETRLSSSQVLPPDGATYPILLAGDLIRAPSIIPLPALQKTARAEWAQL
ncbi:hypothetical protein QR685DRAFT_5421 [Neurospora intermedia]|uniref:Uncharacterized protein n=1 Tax=Neurospora intermedia TaxID=5142 RepID=A0ABR3DQY9_NEUIN